MPIIETIAADDPMSQGDLLTGVPLFVTKKDNHSQTSHKLCLVLSRPCVAIHKPTVTVAAVEKYRDNVPKNLETFGEVLKFLTTLRDGVLTPDLFYLGQIPEHKGRFCARLDSLHTIAVPAKDKDRQAFIQARRVGRLQIEFARDLHLRIFRAFASLGFDDQNWLSDLDLEWLAQQGRTDISKLETQLHEAQTELAKQESSGQEASAKRLEQLHEKLDELKAKIKPYTEQLESRSKTT